MSGVGGCAALARHDFLSLLRSPLGFGVLALFPAVLGLFFFLVFLWDFLAVQPALKSADSSYGITAFVVAPTFKTATVLMLLVTPALCMGSFAGEARRGTLPLLLSSPMSAGALVLGKFLGLLAYLALAVALVSAMTLTLGLGGSLDGGLLTACVLGLTLAASAFAAIGVLISSLCREPTTAAMACLATLVVLWALDPGAGAGGPWQSVLAYLSASRHVDALMRGVFSSADVAYFALLTGTALTLSVLRLRHLRGQA